MFPDNGLALAKVAADIAGVPRQTVAARFENAGLLTHQGQVKKAQAGISVLNSGGAPFQVVFGRGVQVVRLILDPFFDRKGDDRTQKALSLLRREAVGVGQANVVDRLDIASISRPVPQAGAIWLAYDLGKSVIAVYLNSELFRDDPWAEIAQCLSRLLPQAHNRNDALEDFQACMKPVSLAVEIDAEGARVKLYMRPVSNDLSAFLPYLKTHLNSPDFLTLVAPLRPWPARGLTLSVAFDSRTGCPDGIKLDLCLCSTCRELAAIGDIDQRLAQHFPPAQALSRFGQLALIGLGGGGKGSRTNLYYEPRAT